MHAPVSSQRLFLAVFPSAAVLAGAARVTDALRERGDGVAWVKRENMHYTLRFLGEVDAESAVAAAEAANEAAAAHAPFAAALAPAGAFPEPRRARVLWLGMSAGAAAMCALAATLEDALAARGFARDAQPFSPHLTLGRVRLPGDWTARLAAAPAPRARFRVERIELVRSTLGAGGSRYERLHGAALAGNA